jgi:hypothetical protein
MKINYLENCLIGIFLNFENQAGSQNGNFLKRMMAVFRTCPKNQN